MSSLGTASIAGEETEITNSDVLKVYPNPASDVLNISVPGLNGNQNSIRVVDMKGTVMMEEKITRSLQQINISRLPKGVYMLKLVNGDKTTTSKFIKE